MKASKKLIFGAAMFACASVLSAAADLQSVNDQAREDLDAALQRLSDARQAIREESVPLSRRINALKSEVRGLGSTLEREQRAQDTRTIGLEALEGRVAAIQDENDYVSGMMSQFMQELQTQMTAAEQQQFDERIDAVRESLESADVSKKDQYAAQIDLVKLGIQRLHDRFGGAVYAGQAVDEKGNVQTGSFVELGPVSVFASQTGEQGGIIETHQVAVPNATPLNPEFSKKVASLAQSKEGALPLDVTLGAALAIEGSKETVSEHVMKGGIWVWPIIFFAVMAALLAVYKLVEIYSIKQPSAMELGAIVRKIRDGRKDEALADAGNLPWEFGPMIQEAVKNSDQEKELVEEVMYERMLEAQPKVERFLSVIAVTAAVAPLLGLLGTVTGMINTFKMITLFGTGDASSLSGGISEALITTELGLVVAIPSLVAHAMLNRKAQSIMANMEKLSVVFVNGLPGRKEEAYAQ
ncbi:MotA/TolQ/ExbB proton channel family protein [Pelagicoccus sp. SDUM812003]|uniref:MotA/TolQ/ExbB proton channel family protein n=1 Tax=Pelagicoccus sp. SDUM812003 TaxID=3041267 RepID=UPI00280CDC1F|nr:MotA/TolQ/ExbB proton channel family protein [Pelagicoccus sp. SDUM812003]MDQ8205226.1 MotA/TolQ/ExbB proton channel family protein [Pelagicoccus sp. SDUM812003]